MKSAIAIAQEHTGVGGAKISSNNVESAIAVDIAQSHGSWNSSCGEVCIGLKSAITIAQKHTCVGGAVISSNEVESAIAVHIAQGHG